MMKIGAVAFHVICLIRYMCTDRPKPTHNGKTLPEALMRDGLQG